MDFVSVTSGGQYGAPDRCCLACGSALPAAADERPPPPVPDREALGPDLTQHLTARELQVLELLAHRFSNKEIATTLCLSCQTVTKHNANILQKLRAASRRGVLDRAAALGIMPIDGDSGPRRLAQ